MTSNSSSKPIANARPAASWQDIRKVRDMPTACFAAWRRARPATGRFPAVRARLDYRALRWARRYLRRHPVHIETGTCPGCCRVIPFSSGDLCERCRETRELEDHLDY